jgi:beta-lactamase regulating signal transducer with metallopeptidase domain
MIDFLYKSTLCLLVLLAVYHLILEKEKMHRFNRFYLLFSLVFSFVVPFISIEVVTKTIVPVTQTYNYVFQYSSKTIILEQTINYKPIILWSLYGLITAILLFRYIRNILKIVSNIKSNNIVEYKNAKLVLLQEQTPPHTFLNYIFLNKTDYKNRKIEEELFTHELIHVTQKHTLDVLLIETLKTVFWFNPLFFFYKKAIQLNHEFLADDKVINTYKNVPFYQNLLLAHTYTNPTLELTSNLNYSITKKRFIMMTKTASRTRIVLFKIMLLPLSLGLISFICIEKIESVEQIKPSNSKKKDDNKISYSNSIPTPSSIANVPKNQNQHINQPELKVSYEYDLRGANINETALQNSISKLCSYIVSIYKSPEGVDKKDEIVCLQFFLKRDGNLTDINVFNGKGTETETKLISILKSSPKSIFENKYSETDWEAIAIQMNFSPKGLDEIASKQTVSQNRTAVEGFFCIPGTYPLHEVDVKPEFPDGIVKFYQFIGQNYKAPTEPNLKGKILITFVVEKDGSLSEINSIKDIGFGTGEEAVRVIKLSPKWIPGKKDGIAVKVSYSLPITIHSDN